ncbi:MAG: alpha/beta hydrolase [Eubacteriales bacterium]|nr:alpha/beta hydrolase [Eubacteriales bacterium]MDD4324183.1 alpha/beta hydrolase [Eubacteriales bacterium]MDD4541008.1 alpha/beta hydrolase [Eubacteriales bacterium]
MTDYPMRHIASNPSQDGLAGMIPDITFTRRDKDNLQMQILQPWGLVNEQGEDRLYPAVLFVQGSGWTFPQVYFEIPQLAQLARKGYVVATTTHRSLKDGHRAPAFLEDVKTAIRFLRAQADTLHIDPERIGIWGTSSGANAALLVGLTADDPKYKTAEWAEESDAVSFVVDCFGPADTVHMVQLFQTAVAKGKDALEQLSAQERETQTKALASLRTDMQNFVGLPDGSIDMDLVREMSPLERIEIDKTYPPVLILHGDQDELVAYDQSLRLYKAFKDHGTEAEMITVDGGKHEDGFWSQEVLEAIWEFIARHS